jgi:RNA polymerase sigma factor FliA
MMDDFDGLPDMFADAPYSATEAAGMLGCEPTDTVASEQQQLILEHLPLVSFIVKRIRDRLPRHVAWQDMHSAGVLGLVDAVTKFDSSKHIAFRTYAQFRIRGAILDSLRDSDWSPREMRRKGRLIEQAINELRGQLGRNPDELEIAEKMQLDLKSFQLLLGELNGLGIGTLHRTRIDGSNEEELAYIPGKSEDCPFLRCLEGEMQRRLVDALATLPERERLVVTLYYYEELTQREIGVLLGIVESRVSQIHTSAVLRLRAALTDMVAR